MLNHYSFPIDRKPPLPGLQDYPTKMATRSFPGLLGSLQSFFKGMAVVGGHIGGEDRWGYGQRAVQVSNPVEQLTHQSARRIEG